MQLELFLYAKYKMCFLFLILKPAILPLEGEDLEGILFMHPAPSVAVPVNPLSYSTGKLYNQGFTHWD